MTMEKKSMLKLKSDPEKMLFGQECRRPTRALSARKPKDFTTHFWERGSKVVPMIQTPHLSRQRPINKVSFTMHICKIRKQQRKVPSQKFSRTLLLLLINH